MEQAIVNTLRKATDLVLKKFGTSIVLTPHMRVKKQGGVFDYEPQPPRPPQIFNVEPVGATLTGISGASGGITNTEGAKAHTWSYIITGKYDAQVEINDVWKNGDTEYRVISIQPYNGYEKTAVVEAIGKDPAYGS